MTKKETDDTQNRDKGNILLRILLIFGSIFLSVFYISKAVNVGLNSGQTLTTNVWQNLELVTEKINVSGTDFNIDGKLLASGSVGLLTGECIGDYGSVANPGLSCKDILDNNSKTLNKDGKYWIKPTSYTGEPFEVYCDMTTNGGGWTRWYKSSNTVGINSDAQNCKDNGKHYTPTFECIDPAKIGKTNFMFKRNGASPVTLPSNMIDIMYHYNNTNWFYNGWSFGATTNAYTCREYRYNGANNYGRRGASVSNIQTQIECYLK